MKEKLFTILLLLATHDALFSQELPYCQQDSISNEMLKYHPLSLQEFEDDVQEQSFKGSFSSGVTRIIPVVVHIIHQGGVENISDAQVFSQIDVLNKDFRRLNADTINTNPIFLGVAADLEIEFCLASNDPLGNTTNGIDRIFEMDSTLSSIDLIARYGWDNKKYLNFYISKSIWAFSSFPDSPDSTDGIFISHGRFGTIGTAGTEPFAEFARFGRTGTHEVGHYLGLYHTFDLALLCDTNCTTTGDNVCDTPPCNGRFLIASCMPHSTNTCLETPDLPDQVDNYMDYNIDSCMNMFTLGQKSRIDVALNLYRSELWSDSNLIEVGCMNPLGIVENETYTNFNIYPHPLSQHSTLEFDNPKDDIFTLKLYDTQGRLVRSISNITTSEVIIYKADLTSGLYFFQLCTHGQMCFKGKLLISEE